MPSIKKICILGPAYPYKGGIAAFNEQLALELNKLGYSVEIVTFSLQYPSFLFPGKSQVTLEKKSFPFPIFRMVNSINPLNWIMVGKRLKKKKFDIVISRFWIPVMGPSLGTILKIIKRNGHSNIYAIIDNLIPHEKRIGDKLLTRYFLNSLDHGVAMSNKVKADIRRLNKNLPITLTPHPVYNHYGRKICREEACEKLNLDSKHTYVLFFGLIRKYKGLDLLIEAFSHIDQGNIHLLVAGEFYDDQIKYETLISELEIIEKVHFISGFIPDDQVATIFSATTIMALPYRSATQSGITQMGLHFELPMVVTAVGGLPEVVVNNKTGCVIGPTPKEIAAGIIRCLEIQPNIFKQSIAEKKKEYEWETFIENILPKQKNAP